MAKLSLKKPKSELGFFNAFLLIVIIFLPALFAFRHLQQTTSDLMKKIDLTKIDSLEHEMNDFAESLVPTNFIEGALETTETKFGLRTELKNSGKDDPGIYNSNVFAAMRQYLKQEFDLQPVLMIGIEHDFKKIHPFFSPDFDNRKQADKERLAVILAEAVISKVLQRKLRQNEEVFEQLKRSILSVGLPDYENESYRDISKKTLKNMLSPITDLPKILGACLEIYTTSFGSQRIYFYLNGSRQGKHILGGYFIAFASKNVSSAKILARAKKQSDIYSREIVKGSKPVEHRYADDKEHAYLVRHLPEPFQAHISINSKSLGFSDLNYYGLKVSVQNSKLKERLENYSILSSLLQKATLLLIYTLINFFYFNGFNLKGRLRKKIIFISGLIILLPYVLVGYFSGLILDGIDKIRLREVETAAECKMYEISRYMKDMLLRRQLTAIEAKKNINRFLIDNPKHTLNSYDIKKQLPKTLNNETFFVLLKNGASAFLLRGEAERKDSEKFARFLAFKCLNSLAVLEKSEQNSREVDLANLAAGFLSGTKRRYTDGNSLAFESCTIKDVAHMSIFWRMFYFILAGSPEDLQGAIGISFVFLADLHSFGNFLNQLSYDYQNFFRVAEEFHSHSFAVGMLDARGELWTRWPELMTSKNKEKQLLNYVAKENFSGSKTQKDGNKIQTMIWKYEPGDPHLYAGVTESNPDLWVIYMFNLLPLAGGVFSFLSLFLLADFLWELFVRPVKEFIPALDKISEGQYHTRIEIARTDELGLLADSFNSMSEGLEQREKMRRFVSEKLLETVEQDKTEQARSQENELSVLISDIRNFTSLSEKNSPEEIVSLLNDYFTEMEDAIIKFGGSVERFIGDAVVAVFYPEPEAKNQAQRAVNAALAMREKLRTLNEKRKLQGKFEIENGIGIVTDVALSGVTGGKSGRQVFMIIGSAVKKAHELESLTAEISDNKIAVCRKTASMATDQNFVEVAGRSDALRPA